MLVIVFSLLVGLVVLAGCETNTSQQVDSAVESATTGKIDRADDAIIKSDIANVRTALELFSQDNSNKYPVVSSYAGLQQELTAYFNNFPYDAASPDRYHYNVVDGGSNYVLWATLSDGSKYEVRAP